MVIMKTLVLFYTLMVFVIMVQSDSDTTDHSDGEPGCRTQVEQEIRFWRHNFDPTRYWCCDGEGLAIQMLCPRQQAFMQTVRKCVHWSEWKWMTPIAPPSRPAEAESKPQFKLNFAFITLRKAI
ncbi:Peritrophin-15b [Sergentomyia squamirostris]